VRLVRPRWRIDAGRRRFLAALFAGPALFRTTPAASAELSETQRRQFAARALALRDEAVRRGDQPYGAVVVRDGAIVGEGISAVIARGDANAHAERLALADALVRLRASDLAGCLLFGSARACSRCESEAARTRIAFMYFGADATPGGVPGARGVL
jgi:tRNA(Arg) A34 adenosine deaminase TadA